MFGVGKIDALISRISSHKPSLQSSIASITALVEHHGNISERYRARQDRELVRIEADIGMVSGWYQNKECQQTNYEQIIKDLNGCGTRLIFLENIIDFEISAGNFCKETLELFESLRKSRGLEQLSLPDYEETMQNLDFHINLADRRRVQTKSLAKRVQMQLTVVG